MSVYIPLILNTSFLQIFLISAILFSFVSPAIVFLLRFFLASKYGGSSSSIPLASLTPAYLIALGTEVPNALPTDVL